MPVAPQYTPQTEGPSGSNVRLRSFDGGGEAIGRGLQGLGRSVSQFAESEDRIQAHHDDTFARKGSLDYRREAAPIISEYNQLLGEDAIVQAEPVRKRLEELRARYRDSMGNPRMKEMFDQRTEDFAVRSDTGVVDRSISQKWKMDRDTTQGELEEAQRNASASYLDPEFHASQITEVGNAARRLAALNGENEQETTTAVREAVSSAHKLTLNAMLSDDDYLFEEAVAYFEAYKEDMTAGDRNAAAAAIQPGLRERNAAGLFNEIVSGFSSPVAADGGGSSGPSASTTFSEPVGDARISSRYGKRRHPITGKSSFHAGTDYAAPAGSSIMSVAEGTVTEVGYNDLNGHFIRVRHADGMESTYAHMQQKPSHVAGDYVGNGAVIGTVGSTGRSTGPHLHLQIKNTATNKTVDPEEYLQGSVPVGSPTDARRWDKAAVMAEIDKREAEGLISFEQAEEARNYANKRMNRDQSLLADREADTDREAGAWVVENMEAFTDFGQIPEHLRKNLSPADVAKYTGIAARNKKALENPVSANGPIKVQLDLLRIAQPDEFMSMNLGEYAGAMTQAEAKTLLMQQVKMRGDRAEGVLEWTPRTGITTSLNYNSRLDGEKYTDRQKRNILLLMEEFAWKRFDDNARKPLTEADYNEAYRYATEEITTRKSLLGVDVGRGSRERFELADEVSRAVNAQEDQTDLNTIRQRFFQRNRRLPFPEEEQALMEAMNSGN